MFAALAENPSRVVIGWIITVLCLLFVTFTTAAVTLLSCVDADVSVAHYRSMVNDGTALRVRSIPLDPPNALDVFLYGDPDAAKLLQIRTMFVYSDIVCGK